MIRHRNAFTLIELLVVVAVIAVLIAILLPSLGRARQAAKQARTAADMHQMLLAYAQYTADNDDRVLLGFLPSGASWTVTSGQTGITPVSGQPALRYPWRFQPYFKDWRILFNCAPLSAADINAFSYQLSLLPRFGLNSMFVGGDPRTASLVAAGTSVKTAGGGAVVFRGAEARRASNLIVFAETANYLGGNLRAYSADTLPGSCPPEALSRYFQLWPPRAAGMRNWHEENGKLVIDAAGYSMGAPNSADGKKPVVGFFDGHAEAMALRDLDDMRMWANQADAADYNYP